MEINDPDSTGLKCAGKKRPAARKSFCYPAHATGPPRGDSHVKMSSPMLAGVIIKMLPISCDCLFRGRCVNPIVMQ